MPAPATPGPTVTLSPDSVQDLAIAISAELINAGFSPEFIEHGLYGLAGILCGTLFVYAIIRAAT
jgi:hypothetical protein